ncbi:3-deoxy-D-manno-octulosonic acid kinase [Marinomonas dokdonensis]|uniref:3-deoxy-D-manno-octulosonic acid kinase n=1 Tax=Marinomonas dokdonensis TaxID=328224 RepID=UPI00405595FD
MPESVSLSAQTQLLTCDPNLPVDANWFDANYWQQQNALKGTGFGRGAVWFIHNKHGDFVIRHYRRGGLIAKFNRQFFLYTGLQHTRPWQELHLLQTMQELGLPVPKPIGGLVERSCGFYRAKLITQVIPNAQDLFEVLKAGKSDSVDWFNLGQVIHKFHQNGIYHSDLNCHNIMIDKENKIWVIDFDKCQQRPITEQWMQENIARLERSLNKETAKHPQFSVSQTQWQAFLEGYRG